MTVPVEPDWDAELKEWLAPFLAALGDKRRRIWAPVYLAGLLSRAERKSVSPLAREMAPGEREQLHHFVSGSNWDCAPLMALLLERANALAGGPDAHLIVDDTALVKKGRHSPGVARQYCGQLGKRANCQCLVSLTLARREVPVPIGLRLFLPESWDADRERRERCGIPDAERHKPKWELALLEIDRALEGGAQFGDVLADAGYGHCSAFRRGLSARDLLWTVGVQPDLQVYPADARVEFTANRQGRPRKHGEPSIPAVSATAFLEALGPGAFRRVTWRQGTKGKLSGRFAAVHVRPADGAKISRGRRLPGEEAWLIGELRENGERRFYLSNLPAAAGRRALIRSVKARWSCEQAHQQLKQELGLDHFEGRTWLGLCHHALLTMLACCFLQHLRLGGKKN